MIRKKTLILLFLPVLPALGQGVTTDPQLEELRVRAPSGANDDATIDKWLGGLVATLNKEASSDQARQSFLSTLRAVHSATDTTQAFNERLAGRAAELFKTELQKGAALETATANVLTRALIEMDDVRTVPGLLAALPFPADQVRYLGARGLQGLRDRIPGDPNLQSVTLAALQAAGEQESSAVVVARIYLALSYDDTRSDGIDAMTAVLESRVNRYRNAGSLADEAEAVALEYLATRAQLPQGQVVKLVGVLAVLLRLDVERYSGQELLPNEQTAIELRIFSCEALLERLVRPPAARAGDIRGLMQSGSGGAVVQLELLKWIGSEGNRGVLNVAPWNVPLGAKP